MKTTTVDKNKVGRGAGVNEGGGEYHCTPHFEQWGGCQNICFQQYLMYIVVVELICGWNRKYTERTTDTPQVNDDVELYHMTLYRVHLVMGGNQSPVHSKIINHYRSPCTIQTTTS